MSNKDNELARVLETAYLKAFKESHKDMWQTVAQAAIAALQNQQAITNAESSKPDHIGEATEMVDPRDELEELAKIEQKCLKMLPMFTEAKDAEIKALKETIIGLSKKDEQIRILREGLINCQLEFDRLRTESGLYYGGKGLKLSTEALAAADKLNKQE